MPIPITVFTGFVGAGKTTTILGLLASLPKDYKACLLKNEFGDVRVDSQLASQSNLAGVSEIHNGCLCCILVGQMKTALLEITDKYNPDRIFIETSGSAFPAALAFQIRELEQETNGSLKLDAIVTVIDAENFTGYEDTSPTARMQASYTDIILINKWEFVSERQLDVVMDHLHTLNDLTPKIKCNGRGGVDPALIFGLDTKLFAKASDIAQDGSHNDEIEVLSVRRGRGSSHPASCNCNTTHNHPGTDGQNEPTLDQASLTSALSLLPKENVWRVKGLVQLRCYETSTTDYIVNWAFGRLELTRLESREGNSDIGPDEDILLTVMGEHGEVRRFASRFAKALGAEVR
ncbi:hypothetical protein ACEPAF_8578 [Sanghuangporus sanghuang]